MDRRVRESTGNPLATAMRLTAVVPLVTGLGVAVAGPGFLPDSGPVDATTAQELRFFAIWWAAVAVYLWVLADRIAFATTEFRIVCGVLFLSGVARWVSFATHGWPFPLFVGLAAVEVLAPLPLVWCQARVAAARSAA